MQVAEFQAVCPYEIGDMILLSGLYGEEWLRIDDILCVHSVKNLQVTFELSVEPAAGGEMRRFSLETGSKMIKKMIPNLEVEERKSEWNK